MFKFKKNVIFSRISNEWLEMKRLSIKYSTYVKYDYLVNHHLTEYFDKYDFQKIDSSMVSQFFLMKANEDNLSSSTLKTLLYLIKSIVRYANELYHFTIQITGIVLPVKNRNIKVLDFHEIELLENYCYENDNILSLSMLLSLYGGLRIGEICALKTCNIDLNKGIILVCQTVQRIKSQSKDKKTELLVGTPKTQTSYRKVPLPQFVIEHIKKHYQNYLCNNLYFLSNKNEPVDPRCIQIKFQKLCKELNIHTTFHVLRHTYATQCVQKGVDIKSLSEIMGHANVNITLNLYVHSTDEYKINQIEKLNKVISIS